jgi:hypothetical protein
VKTQNKSQRHPGRTTPILTHQRHIIYMVFENRVLRRIFGAKRDEMTGKLEKIA